MFAKSLPSMFTIANLFLGVLAIILIFDSRTDLAAMMVIIAMVTDGLDGQIARALKVQSEFGKELDSLSDVISFGVAPAFIMYVVAFQNMGVLGWIITALFPICGALRLARFNVTPVKKSGYFIGLPIPAAGGVLSTLALFHNNVSTSILIGSTVVLSLLMISTIKYPSFKKDHIPKAVFWITPIVVLMAVAVAIIYPGVITKLLFIPLVLYALYGLKKNVSSLLRLVRMKVKRNKPPLDDSYKLKDI